LTNNKDISNKQLSRFDQWFRYTYSLPIFAGLIAAFMFAITLQTNINGGQYPYTIDVGEIQNALPRWGTLHPFGYPLYSMTGSFFVTLMRIIGINPAAGSSLVSLFWGALAVGLLAQLALELNATKSATLIGVLYFAVSRSMWVDSAIAEVHTMTMIFTIGTLLCSLRFGKNGNRNHLLWLVLISSNGVIHSRSIAFMIPAVFVLIALYGVGSGYM
jgi:hypothetical protein